MRGNDILGEGVFSWHSMVDMEVFLYSQQTKQVEDLLCSISPSIRKSQLIESVQWDRDSLLSSPWKMGICGHERGMLLSFNCMFSAQACI